MIVFTTAFAQFAPQAFDIQACDYVLKPFDEDRVFLALDRAKEALRNQSKRARASRRITVPVGDRMVRLSADEIDWMAAEDNYVSICSGRQVLLARSALRKLQADLKSNLRLRVHRSWVVNVKRVKEVRHEPNHQYTLVLSDGSTIACSRRHKHLLRATLKL